MTRFFQQTWHLLRRTGAIGCMIMGLVGCGGGAPLRITIDEFSTELSLDETVDQLDTLLGDVGFFGIQFTTLPEVWPESLPDIRLDVPLNSDPFPIDLTPEDGGGEFGELQEVLGLIRRIEINRLVLRVEDNTSTVGLPSLNLQVAQDPNADGNDRRLWTTVGTLPESEAGFVGDLEFDYVPGGESFLNQELSDDALEFSMRTAGNYTYDTETSPLRPQGSLRLRLIAVITFFVDPF